MLVSPVIRAINHLFMLATLPPSPQLVSWADKSFTLQWPSSESDKLAGKMPEGQSEIQCREEGEGEWRSVVRLVNYHQRKYAVEDVKSGTEYLCRVRLFHYGKRRYSVATRIKTHLSMIG